MSVPNSPAAMASILRLQGLKNASGRKVMPTPQYLQDLEEEDTDVSGTATPLPDFENFDPNSQNLPESNLGGELTSQAYDVRANSVNPEVNPNQQPPGFWSKVGQALAGYVKPEVAPEMKRFNDSQRQGQSTPTEENPEESSIISKLGKSLSDYVNPEKRQEMAQYNQSLLNRAQNPGQAPPIETAQVDVQEGLPPVTAGQQEYQGSQPPTATPGFWGAIKDWANPTKRAEMAQHNEDLITNAQLRAQGKNPEEVRNQVNENLTQDVEKAMEQPWQYAAYGSANEVANSPALKAEFKKITGIDFEPEIASQVAEHEKAMKGVEDALNGVDTNLDEQAEGIKQRILTNQSTEADKYFIGLALLMPLIIGGIFGKEAGIGALGGAAKGIQDVLMGRQKGIKEDETALLDINKQKSLNQEKLANINLEKAKLRPTLIKNLPEQPNKHLLGMEEIGWTDPDTGKQMKGVKMLPGLVAREEYVNTPDGVKNMQKAANELSEVKTYTDEINDLTDDVVDIVSQLKDPTNAWKGLASIISGKVPGSLRNFSQDVEFEGRKVNAGVLLEEKLGFLANAYGMAKDLGQMDRAAQSHIKKIFDNPTNTLLTPEDSLNQVLEVRKLAQRGLVRSAANKGFYPEFLIKDLESRNNELFGGLNQREQKKRTAEVKKKLLQNETNYAQ